MPGIEEVKVREITQAESGINFPPPAKLQTINQPKIEQPKIEQPKVEQLQKDDVELSVDILENHEPDYKPETKVKDEIQDKTTDSDKTQDKTKDEKVKEDLSFNLDLESDKKEKEKEKDKDEKRDYSEFKSEHVEILSKLPNHLFDKAKEYFKDIYVKEKQFEEANQRLEKLNKGQLPESYYEHPTAYTLDPRFEKVVREIEYDEFEESHFKNQLVRIKKGEDWIKLKGYNQKTGEPVFEKIKALEDGSVDVESELEINELLNRAQSLKLGHQGLLTQIQTSFKNDYNSARQSVELANEKFFPAFKEMEKLPDIIKSSYKKAMDNIHPFYKENPLSNLLAKAFAAHVWKDKKIGELNQKIKQLEDRIKIGPSASELESGVDGKVDKMLSVSDFE